MLPSSYSDVVLISAPIDLERARKHQQKKAVKLAPRGGKPSQDKAGVDPNHNRSALGANNPPSRPANLAGGAVDRLASHLFPDGL